MFWEVDKNCVNQSPSAVLFIFRKCCCICCSNWFKLFVNNKFKVYFHFPVLQHFPLCLRYTCILHVLFISCDAATVVPYIWEHLICWLLPPPLPPLPPPQLLGQFFFGGVHLISRKALWSINYGILKSQIKKMNIKSRKHFKQMLWFWVFISTCWTNHVLRRLISSRELLLQLWLYLTAQNTSNE